MEHGPVVPARLCTLFSGPDALRDFLAANADGLRETLDRLRGHREWSLKVYCDEVPAPGGLRRRRTPRRRPGDPGRRRKRGPGLDAQEAAGRVAWRRRVTERSEQAACAVFDEMATLVGGHPGAPHPDRGGQRGRRAHDPERRAARLRRGRAGDARRRRDAAPAKLAAEGCRLALSGPWPAFTLLRAGSGRRGRRARPTCSRSGARMAPGLLLHVAVPAGEAKAATRPGARGPHVADGRVAAILGPCRWRARPGPRSGTRASWPTRSGRAPPSSRSAPASRWARKRRPASSSPRTGRSCRHGSGSCPVSSRWG